MTSKPSALAEIPWCSPWVPTVSLQTRITQVSSLKDVESAVLGRTTDGQEIYVCMKANANAKQLVFFDKDRQVPHKEMCVLVKRITLEAVFRDIAPIWNEDDKFIDTIRCFINYNDASKNGKQDEMTPRNQKIVINILPLLHAVYLPCLLLPKHAKIKHQLDRERDLADAYFIVAQFLDHSAKLWLCSPVSIPEDVDHNSIRDYVSALEKQEHYHIFEWLQAEKVKKALDRIGVEIATRLDPRVEILHAKSMIDTGARPRQGLFEVTEDGNYYKWIKTGRFEGAVNNGNPGKSKRRQIPQTSVPTVQESDKVDHTTILRLLPSAINEAVERDGITLGFLQQPNFNVSDGNAFLASFCNEVDVTEFPRKTGATVQTHLTNDLKYRVDLEHQPGTALNDGNLPAFLYQECELWDRAQDSDHVYDWSSGEELTEEGMLANLHAHANSSGTRRDQDFTAMANPRLSGTNFHGLDINNIIEQAKAPGNGEERIDGGSYATTEADVDRIRHAAASQKRAKTIAEKKAGTYKKPPRMGPGVELLDAFK